MLALLALLYQWDLTFHTETAVFLGEVGYATSAAWAALFVGKLHLLERALGVRLAPHAWHAALLAAAGLAIGPRVLPWLGERGAGSLLAAWVFALGVLAQRPQATLTARSGAALEVDPWLLRRLTRATWRISAALLAVHLLFLAKDHRIGLPFVAVTAPLLLVRRMRDERAAWLLVTGALGVSFAVLPGALSVAALLSAAALLLRAFAPLLDPPTAAVERDRLVVGAVVTLPLSAWTLRHALSLPRSSAQWGLVAVSLGFLLLAGSLASSYRRVARPAPWVPRVSGPAGP